jgi:4a-hydroxytetrahydrobiopterin dehydratase
MNKLTNEKIKNSLKTLKGWKLKDGSIKKSFKTKGFPQTMGLVASIGALCQQFDHHPDYLTLKYAEVEVAFSTHTAGGITDKDIEIAKAIENL